ncbi:hypothetical protein Pst134EA_017726 [Puccinia striiformis f. sp. tritici]|uniref:hypothetical protein n=1 Tax=Puccinia striiformis f. sp. tritici TaxID=168172 RepID=UPI00200859BD|nr:hypothetical protein Pst134EA_017726 [Puccinia striiformis f. sp. tritici]KAH9461417.1 hypothetical protein Pst134EA_017726 [Puccinia striiformis f. sp. tritici]
MSGQNNNDGFQQAMLKTALETTPQLSEENYSIWKDKMTALLQLRGVLTTLNDEQTDAAALADDVNAELILLFIAKIDSVTHNNVVTADNRNSARALWKAIKDRFASDESSNRARVFNKFLYVQFKEDGSGTLCHRHQGGYQKTRGHWYRSPARHPCLSYPLQTARHLSALKAADHAL